MTVLQTGFHSRTEAAGASFVEYEGYWLPSSFSTVAEEHAACRQRAVVMDLSPLRKFEVTGPGAADLLQATMTRDIAKLADGQVVYTAMCDEAGAVVDDGTVFRFDATTFRWVGYTDDDEAWLCAHADRLGLDVTIEASTPRLHNIAVQGPASRDIVRHLVAPHPGRPSADELTWFRFTEGHLGDNGGPAVLLSRTGYSGELGYELWCHPDDAPDVWDAVAAAGAEHGLAGHGLQGLGLDALDVVRIEAGLVFKGYEYTGTEDPFEAGIGFTVPRAKADAYVGQGALERRRAAPGARLVGLECDGDGVPEGDVRLDGVTVGAVTSPCWSPQFQRGIALARVDVSGSEAVAGSGERVGVGSSAAAGSAVASGTRVEVEVGGGKVATATVTRIPFYDPDKTRPRS